MSLWWIRCVLCFIAGVAMYLASFPRVADARLAASVPGTLRLAITSEPNSLNPILQTQVIESFIESLTFDALFETHADGEIDPLLAREVPTLANGDISRDGRAITIHLRPGITWRDGVRFTSADVAFTQAARLNPANDTNRSPFDQVVRLDTPDTLTVVVHLREPNAAFLANWGVYPIVPAHLLKSLPNVNNASFNAQPVGTGPFVFDHWERAHEIVLNANDRYVLGPPNLRTIIITLVPDENSAAVALRAHEVDMVYFPSAAMRPLVAGDPTLRFLSFNANGVEGIDMNMARAPLDDRRVRQAISLAIDRRELVEKVQHGLATPATGSIPSYSWAADPTLPVPYDPDRSRALLRAAGWRPGPDGIRAKNGKSLSVSLTYPSGSGTVDTAVLLVQPMLRAVGIDVTLKPVQPNVLFAPASAGGLLQTGAYELSFTGFFSPDDPDDSRRFLCSARAPNGFNVYRWCDPSYDALARAALATYDPAQRRALYAKVERKLLDAVPIAFLWWPTFNVITSADVQHVIDPQHHDLSDARFWRI